MEHEIDLLHEMGFSVFQAAYIAGLLLKIVKLESRVRDLEYYGENGNQ